MAKTAASVLGAWQGDQLAAALQNDTSAAPTSGTTRALDPTRMLRLSQVMARTELRKTTIYKLQKEGHFPRAVSLTGHSVRWIESEVEEWLAGRRRARDEAT
jgi:prophage regulatory protein